MDANIGVESSNHVPENLPPTVLVNCSIASVDPD